jgi:predicted transcriptional regulator
MGDPMSEKQAFVMMIQGKWWNEFCRNNHNGKRIHSYMKLGLAPPKETSSLLFYVTKPIGQITGYAEFIERRVGDVEKMWQEYGRETVLDSKEKYKSFVGNSRRISFIRFKDLHEAKKPLPLSNALLFLGVKRLPRRGFYLDKETTDELVAMME